MGSWGYNQRKRNKICNKKAKTKKKPGPRQNSKRNLHWSEHRNEGDTSSWESSSIWSSTPQLGESWNQKNIQGGRTKGEMFKWKRAIQDCPKIDRTMGKIEHNKIFEDEIGPLKEIAQSIIKIEEILRKPNQPCMSSSNPSESPEWPGYMHNYYYSFERGAPELRYTYSRPTAAANMLPTWPWSTQEKRLTLSVWYQRSGTTANRFCTEMAIPLGCFHLQLAYGSYRFADIFTQPVQIFFIKLILLL